MCMSQLLNKLKEEEAKAFKAHRSELEKSAGLYFAFAGLCVVPMAIFVGIVTYNCFYESFGDDALVVGTLIVCGVLSILFKCVTGSEPIDMEPSPEKMCRASSPFFFFLLGVWFSLWFVGESNPQVHAIAMFISMDYMLLLLLCLHSYYHPQTWRNHDEGRVDAQGA